MMKNNQPEDQNPDVIILARKIIDSLQADCSGFPCEIVMQLCVRIAELEIEFEKNKIQTHQ